MNDLEYYPLTHPQKSIWYIEKMFPNTSISNVAGTARIKGIVDFDLLDRAINLFIEKNDALRIRISNKNGEDKQYINVYNYKKIDFFDFSQYDDPDEHMYKWNEEQTSLPFELYESDLAYFATIKINDQESAFYAKTHHIISDAWTMSLFVNEVLTFYSALKEGEDIHQEKYPSYIDYVRSEAEYKNSDKFFKDQQYWLNKFDPFPEATVLKTRTTNEKRTESKRKTILTPAKFTNKLREFCKENNTTAYPLFLAALAMYINRITSKNDIVIGTPVLNRSNRKDKNTTGMFINTLPLRINIDSDTNFKTFSSMVSMECMSLFRHQKYPYDLLLKDIRAKYNKLDNLYDIVLSYQNSKMEKQVIDEQYMSRWHFNHHQVNSLTIHINDRDDDGRLIIDYDFHEDMYSVKEIEFLHTHMLSLLWHALDNPEKNINKIEMLPENEKNKVLYEFNNTKADYPKDKTIHQLFEEQVQKTPNKIAIIFEDKKILYKDLNLKANQMAWELREIGVMPNSIVGIMVSRSFELIIGILAILKAGGAYLPIDPEYPKDRIEYILEDSKASVLLIEEKYYDTINYKGNIILADKKSNYKESNSINPASINSPTDLAYVIYTSGSTGKPKGVMIEHKSVNNFVTGVSERIDFLNKTILSLTTVSFDIFVLETILPLVCGTKIVLANEKQQKMPQLISEAIKSNGVNMLQATPSRIQMILNDESASYALSYLSDLLIGGEALPHHILLKLKQNINTRIYNLYGPTETTVWSTIKDLTGSSEVDIGTPISNTQIYILDKYMNLVPIGVEGELYIGGVGLARGYVYNSELTAEKFIPNPFLEGEKIYKTGDLARWFPKGDIEFLGRIDYQIKLHGFRIELGEIEHHLLSYPSISKAVVIDNENKEGQKYLCAYFISENDIETDDLKNHLAKNLPYYMIPSFYIKANTIPLTPNGKIDRKALLGIEKNKVMSVQYRKPETETEKTLYKIWKDILNIKRISKDSSFFEIGGDSLKAIQLQVCLLQYGWNLTTQDIYKYNTIRKLSDKITKLDCGSLHQSKNSTEIALPNSRTEHAFTDLQIEKTSFNNVLLTGATGFLGIHILDYILSHSDRIVYCIVRGESLTHAKSRLTKSLFNYFRDKHTDVIDKRVYVLNGDITRKNLGLFSNENTQINIDAVIHAAALVKYFGDYSEFEKANVLGTLNTAEFAANNNIPLFYVSTMGLSGRYQKGLSLPNSVFSEIDLYHENVYENDMYLRSKYKAEKIINRYISSGLQAAIFRVGNLTGRYSDGHFQMNISENYFYNVLKSILSIGAVSDNILDIEFDLTPVDLCSKAIVELGLTKNCLGSNFHVFNHNMINIDILLKFISSMGVHITLLSEANFVKLIKKLSYNNNKNLQGIVNNLNTEFQLDFGKNVKICSDFSVDFLKKIGFHWPAISEEYIHKLINYMEKEKFILF